MSIYLKRFFDTTVEIWSKSAFTFSCYGLSRGRQTLWIITPFGRSGAVYLLREAEARWLLSRSIERSVLCEMFMVNVHWFWKYTHNSWHFPPPSPSNGCTWLSQEASWFIQDTSYGSSLLASDNQWFDSLPKISSLLLTIINPLLWLQIDAWWGF
jgi:hypothetical protein